eukprot:3190092-Rhodomonas_salina.2
MIPFSQDPGRGSNPMSAPHLGVVRTVLLAGGPYWTASTVPGHQYVVSCPVLGCQYWSASAYQRPPSTYAANQYQIPPSRYAANQYQIPHSTYAVAVPDVRYSTRAKPAYAMTVPNNAQHRIRYVSAGHRTSVPNVSTGQRIARA